MNKKILLRNGRDYTVVPMGWPERNSYRLVKAKHTCYAARDVRIKGQWRMSFLHREILGLRFGDKKEVDHKDGNGLNNSLDNLTIVSKAQNAQRYRTKIGGTSRYRGVFRAGKQKWCAYITFNYRRLSLGVFSTEREAAVARDDKARSLFGKGAYLNIL